MKTEGQSSPGNAILMHARGLTRSYTRRRGNFRADDSVQALCGVDLEIRKGSTMALVGESGSGKSTLARCLSLLEQPDSGEIWFDDREITALRGQSLFHLRRKIQLIFQDPTSAMNPRLAAEEIVAEPLLIQKVADKGERRRRARELMAQVGLSTSLCLRRPYELSGGQRQRLAIARALALEPQLLILDEAFAGLDLSIQAQLVNLLLDLQAGRSLTCLYISHDLSLVAHVADEIAVLYHGEIVERASTRELFADARHVSTQSLLESIPFLPSSGRSCDI